MNPTVTKALAEVVTELTNANELFTAFDVTSKLRYEKGCTVYHSEVKNAIDDLYINLQMPSDYVRDLVTVEVGKPKAFVYKPSWEKTSNYDKNRHQKGNGDPFVVDSRGRLCVPKKYLAAIGAHRYDYVNVWVSNFRVYVSRDMSINQHVYRVDKSGNVRINKSVMTNAHLVGTARRIKKDGNKIVVS